MCLHINVAQISQETTTHHLRGLLESFQDFQKERHQAAFLIQTSLVITTLLQREVH